MRLKNYFSNKDISKTFTNEKFLPPFKTYDPQTKIEIEFKSFNTKFLIWFFNQENCSIYYEEFIKEEGNKILDYLINDLHEHLINRVVN